MAAAGTAIVYRGVLTAAEFDPVLAAKVIGRWSATEAGAGTTVLGTHPDYQDMELERRVNALQVGPKAWSFLVNTSETWTGNQAFLGQAISRGDDLILATSPEGPQSWTYFAQELSCLRNLCYVLDSSTSSIVIPH
jgi:hypothetical protein